MRLINWDALIKEAGKLWSEMPDGEELSKELMKAINHAPTVGGWISVKDRLPEFGVLVLVAHKADFGFGLSSVLVNTAMLQEYGFCGGGYDNFLDGACDAEVTHWMPLPEPPEEVSGDE